MCSVNDAKRKGWQGRITELNNEKNQYVEKQKTIDNCCTTLNCLAEKSASLGEVCSHIDTGGIIDGGKGAVYSSGFTSLSSDLASEKAAYQNAINVIDMNIRVVQTLIDNLPVNCGSCSECCPPVSTTIMHGSAR